MEATATVASSAFSHFSVYCVILVWSSHNTLLSVRPLLKIFDQAREGIYYRLGKCDESKWRDVKECLLAETMSRCKHMAAVTACMVLTVWVIFVWWCSVQDASFAVKSADDVTTTTTESHGQYGFEDGEGGSPRRPDVAAPITDLSEHRTLAGLLTLKWWLLMC